MIKRLLMLGLGSSMAIATTSSELSLKETYQKISAQRQRLVKQIETLKSENRKRMDALNSCQKLEIATQGDLKKIEEQSRQSTIEFQTLCQTFNTENPLETLTGQLTEALKKINAQPPLEQTVFLKDGTSMSGKLTVFGPMAYFESSDHKTKGIAVEQNGLFLLKEINYSGVLAPVYFSKKEALLDSNESFMDHLKKGKATMIPMVILALVCLVVAIVRGLALIGIVKKQYELEVKEIAEVCMTDEERALELAQTLPRPLNSIMKVAIKHREVSKEHLEEVLYERVTLEIPALDKWLTILAVGASAAPLLGLLGTVTGMIHTFALITQHGSGDAALLSSGISEALVTTEVGLVIAIPALIVHAWLSRKVSRAVAMTQKGALIFVNALKVK